MSPGYNTKMHVRDSVCVGQVLGAWRGFRCFCHIWKNRILTRLGYLR